MSKQKKGLSKKKLLATSHLLQNALVHHQAGRLQEAEVVYQSILDKYPQHPDALHLYGVLAHQTGQSDTAIELIGKSIEFKPNNPEVHYNLGNIFKELGRNEDAVASYKKVLALSPNNAETHYNLGVVYMELGRQEDAIRSYQQALEINPNKVEAHYNLGVVFMALGRNEDAMVHYEKALAINPNNVEAHSNLGIIFYRLARNEDAITQYKKALSIKPDYAEVYNDLGIVSKEMGNIEEAITYYEEALSINSDFVEAYNNLGIVYKDQGQIEEAIANYEKALGIKPDNIDVSLNLAELYEQLNQLDKARFHIDKTLKTQPTNPVANKLAAILLKRDGKYKEALDILGLISPEDVSPKIQYSIHFEMGKLYDLVKNHDLAIYHFTEGNRIQAECHFVKESDENVYLRDIKNIKHQFTQEWVQSWSELAVNNEVEPIVFLVGFPRSGTTLLDQILDSHPKIQVIEEKPMIENVIKTLSQSIGDYPDALASLSNNDVTKLRDQYLLEVDKFIDKQANSLLVDKFPLNIAHIGLISRLFPKARIILALRHPYDVCLSNFMQQFQINSAMANFISLEGAANLYSVIMRLWQTYSDLLPLDYHVIKYESLVDNIELETRKLIDFLGVDWDPALLDHTSHAKSRGHINTPSYSQVTQPIYNKAVNRWQRYEKHLMPIMEILEPYINDFGYREVQNKT